MRQYTRAERDTVRKLFTEKKTDQEIAAEIGKTRPGTTMKAIADVRSNWGYVTRHIKRKRVQASPVITGTVRGRVIIKVGSAEFHTDKTTARTVLDILAGI